jgi:hypothetical protein
MVWFGRSLAWNGRINLVNHKAPAGAGFRLIKELPLEKGNPPLMYNRITGTPPTGTGA